MRGPIRFVPRARSGHAELDALAADHRRSLVLRALALDLFTMIAAGTRTAAALARRCGTSELSVGSLCDYLVLAGLLSRSGGGYAVPVEAAHLLDRRSPAFVGRDAPPSHR